MLASSVISCQVLKSPLQMVSTTLNTLYGANRYSPSPLTKVLVTKEACLHRRAGLVLPRGSTRMHHKTRGLVLGARARNPRAIRFCNDVARNPGTRYFFPISKNSWTDVEKPVPHQHRPSEGYLGRRGAFLAAAWRECASV